MYLLENNFSLRLLVGSTVSRVIKSGNCNKLLWVGGGEGNSFKRHSWTM